MASSSRIAPWEKEVGSHSPTMSGAQVRVLAEASLAMLVTMRCGTTHISEWLAKYEGQKANTVRQRVREWYYEAKAKRGKGRTEVVVEEHFPELLAWALEGWEGGKELALVLDATMLSDLFISLSLGIVVQGCLIPIAWVQLPGGEAEAWQGHWVRLVSGLDGVIPADWHVVVLTDRGLYAGWLYRAIQANGWHPLMRVKDTMGFRTPGERTFQPIRDRVRRRGRHWEGEGEWSERGERLRGRLMVRWETGYEERLAVVSDEEVPQIRLASYQMRFWTEDGFKDQKRGGWRWEQTKMKNPQRASRLWFVLAVAMQWGIRVGSEEEGREVAVVGSRRKRGKKRGRPRKDFGRARGREQSVLVRGQQSVSVALSQGRAFPLGHVIAPAWPRQVCRGSRVRGAGKRKQEERRRRTEWKQIHQ